MTEADSFVTREMENQKGIWGAEIVSYPISESDIRKWAIAVYWPATPPRLFWDPEYAGTTRWGGIVAPEDFNPFAWPVPMDEVEPMGKPYPALALGRAIWPQRPHALFLRRDGVAEPEWRVGQEAHLHEQPLLAVSDADHEWQTLL